jgi:hypothetical protein
MWIVANQAYPLDGLAKDYVTRLQVDFVDLHTIAMIAQNAVSRTEYWILRSAAADNYCQRRATIQD